MDAFTLAARLTLESKDFEKSLSNEEKNFSDFGVKIGKAMQNAGKVIGVGLGVAVTAVGGLVKAAVNAYAEYEQLVGGVETLFKESAGSVQAYADVAYITAGMSANQYMETVTSFSASLLQGLEGDTKAATEYANMAIIDMSDNANKMGTSIDAIQVAYQGFAKQNYTMLDNLKLGYGGTKTEMERLIDDANKVKEAHGEMADLSIERFSDVVEAIHIIQEEMGITGTTANEASTTIEGSINSTKAAWENLIVEFGKKNGDIKGKIDILVETAETAFKNLTPVIENALSGIATFIEEISPIIAAKLPGIIADIGPKLISAAATLAGGVLASIPSLLTAIFEVITSADWVGIGTKAWNTMSSAFANIAEWFDEKFNKAVEAIGKINWKQVGTDIVDNVGTGLDNLWKSVSGFFKDAYNEVEKIKWADIGEAITNAVTGTGSVLLGIGDKIVKFFSNALKDIQNIEWSDIAIAIRDNILGTGNILLSITESIVKFFTDALHGVQEIEWSNIAETIKTSIVGAGTVLSEIGEAISQFFYEAMISVQEIEWSDIATSISSAITGAGSVLLSIPDNIASFFETALTTIEGISWGDIGSAIDTAVTGTGTILSGIGDAIAKFFSDATDKIAAINWTSVGSNIWTGIKNGLTGIASWFKARFDNVVLSVSTINWAELGTNILGFITGALEGISGTITGFFETAKTDISTISWYDLGATIRDKIKGAIEAIKTTILPIFNDAIDNIKAISWTDLGDSIKGFIEEGLTGVDEFLTGLFGQGWTDLKTQIGDLTPIFNGIKEAIDGAKTAVSNIITWFGELLKNESLLQSFGKVVSSAWGLIRDTATAIVTAVKNIIKKIGELFGKEGEAKAFGDAIAVIFDGISQVVTIASSVITGVIGAIGDVLSVTVETIGGLIQSIVGWINQVAENDKRLREALSEPIDVKPLEDGETAAQRFSELVTAAFEAVEEESPVEMSAEFDDEEAITDISGYLAFWGKAKEKDGDTIYTKTINDQITNIITNYSTNGSSSGGSGSTVTTTSSPSKKNKDMVTLNARSMFGGTILRGATLFGWDAQGIPQIGGGEGPEAVVGVGSLNQQIKEAVREGLSGIVASIAKALNGDKQPIYVVLDTGELVGAIGPKVDAELGRLNTWKSGGAA